MSRLSIVVALAIVIAVVIPVILYLTYPVDEEEVVEYFIERVYGSPPQRLPRFVPGVVGYASPIGRDYKHRGTLVLRGKEPMVVIASRDGYLPVVLLHEYRCLGNISSTVPGDVIANRFNNRTITVVGYFFRTSRGSIVIPIEIDLNGTRCIYLRQWGR